MINHVLVSFACCSLTLQQLPRVATELQALATIIGSLAAQNSLPAQASTNWHIAYYTATGCFTLLVSAEPRHSMTALDVKFSEAMSSRHDHCLVFSFSIRSYISGSCCSRATLPGRDLGTVVMAECGVSERRAGSAWLLPGDVTRTTLATVKKIDGHKMRTLHG
jgi:hypothetical protein